MTLDEAISFQQDQKLLYRETSAKTGKNITETFYFVSDIIYNKIVSIPPEIQPVEVFLVESVF